MIITDEKLLRVNCDPVLPSEVEYLRKKLELALDWSARQNRPGVGLACPQIGIAKKMAIVRVDNVKIDLVNAKITKKYHQFEFDGEGCLSFPGRYERTLRYKEIVVDGNLVEPFNFIAVGFIAVICQHEMGHLENVLLPDVMINKQTI
jgi:peptide deformylase